MTEIVTYSNCQPLALSDPAYDTISKGVRDSWPGACITMIDKINIPLLRTAYEKWRKELEGIEQANPSIKDGIRVAPITREFTVYHGTKEANVENICKNGFDPTKGRNMVYGFGIYFASQFKTSWSYTGAETDETKLSYIFICKILPGRITTAASPTAPLPPGFHSRADMPSAPTIFAIPEAHMMIPEYLVRFSKRAEASISVATGELSEKYLQKQLAAALKKIEAGEKKRAAKTSKKSLGSS